MILTNFHKFQNFGNFLTWFGKFDWKSDTRHSFLEFGAKSGKNSSNIRIKNAKFESFDEEIEKIGNSIIQSRKHVDDFWLKFWEWRTVQRSALCRSRRELSNEYLLAKIGVDTAENEPLEVCGKLFNIIQSCPYSPVRDKGSWPMQDARWLFEQWL